MLVTNIINNNLPIDIYGRGAKKYGVNVKGEFENVEPYKDYYFSICVENHTSNEYISEKILDAVLHNTPIYFGAKNILNYFNETIVLTGDIIKDLNIIKSVLIDPTKYYKPTYHEKNLKKINFFHQIENFFVEK